MRNSHRVLIVGSAENSGGGVSSVIKLIKKMPIWEKYSCYWLGTQIQAGKWTKLWYAVKSYVISVFIMWRYDIVHFHTVPDGNSLYVQLPVFLLAKLLRKHIITHLHVGNQLETAANNKFFIWWLNESDMIVLLANNFKEQFSIWYPNVKTPTRVIYNACEMVDVTPYELHENTILFAGAFRPNKDGATLIKAFATIHNNFPEWNLVLLGSGPEKEHYDEIIKKEGISSKVLMPGYVVGNALQDYFKKAGIYCLCSHHEGFPMVVLEAWAYGVPVITTPVGGLPDVLEDGVNALVFNYRDVDVLANSLKELMGNEAKRKEMSLYSRSFSAQKFSLEIISQSIDVMYKELIFERV